MTQRRPKRRAKPELYFGGGDKTDTACHYAIAPFDRVAREMDDKWGIDRLPELVPPELAVKYGKALGAMNAAIQANDPQACADTAANCIKGMAAMDKAATDAGHKPHDPPFWEYELDDTGERFRFAIMPDNRDWKQIKKQRPDLVLYSMREVALLLREKAGHPWVEQVKDAFPGAEVVATRPKTQRPPCDFEGGGDELPF